jgi:hypothetical protein
MRNSTSASDHGALLDEVDEAARRGDDDVDAAAQLVDLRAGVDAAQQHRGARAHIAAVGADILLDLQGQFARGGQHQRQRRVAGVLGALGDVFDHRQHEGRRLAGARLGRGQHVAPGAHERDGGQLDGGGFLVAAVRECTQDGLTQSQVGEGFWSRGCHRGHVFLSRCSGSHSSLVSEGAQEEPKPRSRLDIAGANGGPNGRPNS